MYYPFDLQKGGQTLWQFHRVSPRVSQEQHKCHLGPDHSELWEMVMDREA